jgi:uncharacterized protein YraI
MISRKTTISAAALLLASAGAAAAFPATATTDLNVRSGPGTGYSVVDQLQAGDTVEVVATRGSWYQTAEGGWASGSYLETSGGQSTYIESGGYGPVAFYYDDNPYYYDDAGFYFYIDSGRRHRVNRDWFRDRDHRSFRWSHARHRDRFERHYGGRRGDGQHAGNWGDGDGPKGGKNWQGKNSQGGANAGASVNDDGISAEGGGQMQVGRSATEGDGSRRGGGDGPRMGGPGRGGPGGGDFEGGRRGGDGGGRGPGGGGQWQPRGQ